MLLFLTLPLFISRCLAKTVIYDWDIGWVTASPDGFTRPVIGINGQWPPPKVEADVGDTIVVNVKNSLGNETTGLHWHGMYQQGTSNMDGATNVHQCPIPPNGTFKYQFTAYPSGSFWYHSHNKGQYPDGLRGALIVHDKTEKAPSYQDEFVMTVSDWYHRQMPELLSYYLGRENLEKNRAAEPLPQSALINDGTGATIKMKPGKSVLVRIINISALSAHLVKFDDHNMTIFAIDGVKVKPEETESIIIAAAQRYDVIITGKEDATRNYAFVSQMNHESFKTSNDSSPKFEADGILEYDAVFSAPSPMRLGDDQFQTLDDMSLVPLDGENLLPPPNQTVTLNVKFMEYPFGQRSSLGSTPYLSPKVPTLYTALTTKEHAMNPAVYGFAVNPYVFKFGEVIQVVVNNQDGHAHPFHLHTGIFQVLYRGKSQPFNGNEQNFRQVPMKRDTVTIDPSGSLVLRFRVDNPGIMLFHCHMEWHVESGMSVTFIAAPDRLQQQQLVIPPDHLQICKDQGIPTEGNCAGNVVNPLQDLDRCSNQIDPNPHGALVSPTPKYSRPFVA